MCLNWSGIIVVIATSDWKYLANFMSVQTSSLVYLIYWSKNRTWTMRQKHEARETQLTPYWTYHFRGIVVKGF